MDLADQVEGIIARDKLFYPGDRIVVAVSGGPDSTALLHLLFLLSGKWGWELVAAHANHGFRPGESLDEAEFVRKQAEELGLPFAYKELDVPGFLLSNGGNPQEAARELRYRFLLETAREYGAHKVALAHHAGDQAETVLMRILRGTGVTGLAGISSVKEREGVKLVRPLLRINKNTLLEELALHGIGYVTDSSNSKLKYTRNRLRLETLPMLERYNPSVTQALNRLAVLAAEDDDYMEREAEQAFHRLAQADGAEVRFSREEFAALHVALQRRFIKLILNYLFFTMEYQDFAAVEQIRMSLLAGARPNARTVVSGQILLVREYDKALLSRYRDEADSKDAYTYSLEGPEGRIFIPEAKGWLEYSYKSSEEVVPDKLSAFAVCFDAEALCYPLQIRSRKAGDRMQVDGLNGSKKVKDIFIDDKVPASRREVTPILTDGEDTLLWIPGIRRSGLARISDATRQTLCLLFRPQPEGEMQDQVNVPF
jgi:tRNA(Ile)-lysidine synthase